MLPAGAYSETDGRFQRSIRLRVFSVGKAAFSAFFDTER